MLRKFKVEINNKSLYFFFDSKKASNILENDPEKLTKTIPGIVKDLGVVDDIDESKDYIYYKNSFNSYVRIDKCNNISKLSLNENNLFFPDLVYLAICMLANMFQKENKFFIQASVVKYDDNGSIMFIGEPGSGKTTLSTKLALTGNWSLISNDNVLIGMDDKTLSSIAGSKSVQMRYGGIKTFFPDMLNCIEEPKDLGKRDEWDIKLYVDDYLKEKTINYCDESKITDIYIINTNKSNCVSIRQRECIDQILLIYEQLTKQIRSNRYVLTSFKTPIPSFEDEKYLQMRYDSAEKIIKAANVYDLKGDVDRAVLELRKKHEK